MGLIGFLFFLVVTIWFAKAAKTKFRLFRDKYDNMLGGVCSGLARRYKAIIPRVCFVLGFFIFGWSVVVYIVLWVVLDKR